MKTVTIHLSDTECKLLRALASVEDQTMADAIHKAIHEYIRRKASHAEFRAALERAIQGNVELIAELAES